ncbi:unnamed protein product [Protopolystoma xenopodis]|uniref:Uncharacterized protein n=1 Tax=Protopolystoma xenopodis TaxID=117903 RepID=A0A448WAT7_9PLAT|nr:unnamed protein product [Protopolystoma xenopodis]
MLALYERKRPQRLAKMTVPSSVGLFQLVEMAKSAHNAESTYNCLDDINGGLFGDGDARGGPIIIGHVYIHPTATVDKNAVVSLSV